MKYSLLEGFERYDMLLAAVAIGENKLIFVLDSGSTHNLIASFAYKKLESLFTPVGKKMDVCGIEGNHATCDMVTADINLGECYSRTLFAIADIDNVVKDIMKEYNIQIHGLLGIPFLRANNCTIDFGAMSIDIAGPKQMKEAV